MVFKINKSCARRTTDSDWWAVPYARFLSASPYRNDGIQTALQTRQNGCSFYSVPLLRQQPTTVPALHRNHCPENSKCISGPPPGQPYRNFQRMQRMVTIQAIILKTGFQGEMLVQTTFHAYPGRERHMKIPFRQGSADACFQCPIPGLDGSILSISASLWPGFEW